MHLRLALEAFSLSEFAALHVQSAGLPICMCSKLLSPSQIKPSKTNEPFFLHPFGAERITANHCADGGLYLPPKLGRFGVRVREACPGVIGLVGVRVLRRGVSRSWSVVRSRLVISHEVGVCTRTGKLRVMGTGGSVVDGAIVFLLQR